MRRLESFAKHSGDTLGFLHHIFAEVRRAIAANHHLRSNLDMRLLVEIDIPDVTFVPVFEELIKGHGQLPRASAAALLSTTDSAFSRAFKQTHKVTFRTARRRIRLLLAACMLIHSHLRVSEIAYLLGYAGSQEFRRMFKREYGCAPTHFRVRRVTTPWLMAGPISLTIRECRLRIIHDDTSKDSDQSSAA
jgi:AraC-like DNA-binding protein